MQSILVVCITHLVVFAFVKKRHLNVSKHLREWCLSFIFIRKMVSVFVSLVSCHGSSKASHTTLTPSTVTRLNLWHFYILFIYLLFPSLFCAVFIIILNLHFFFI